MATRPSRRRPAPEPGEVEDPLAADKRTLAIGASAMLVFVLIGVVSAQLFVTGSCVPIGEPTPVAAGTEAATDRVDAEALGELERLLEVDLTQAAPVAGDVDRLAAGPDGRLLAVGDVVTLLDDGLAPVSELEVPGVVVGDGPTLFDVALTNELTGQVDAFTPIEAATLEAGSCTDTTVVSEQFSFLLDAREGQLLQLRLDEDGDGPAAELRDAQGHVTEIGLTLPAGPAGVLGERFSGALGDDVVVLTRRVAPDDDQPPVLVTDHAGEVTLEVDRTAVLDAGELGDDLAVRVTALVVAGDRALLHVRPDPAQGEPPSDATDTLVWLDLVDGSLDPLGATAGHPTAAAAHEGGVALALVGEAESRGVLVTADEVVEGAVLDEGVATVRWIGGQAWAITDGGSAVPLPSGAETSAPSRDPGPVAGLEIRDLAEVDGRPVVLVHVDGRSVVLAG